MDKHTEEFSRAAPPEWIEALAESEDDFAAGRIVDGAAMKRRLRETLSEMQGSGSRMLEADPPSNR